MMADAVVKVDVTEAVNKLNDVLKILREIERVIDSSWLLRLICYGTLTRRKSEPVLCDGGMDGA